MTTQITPTQAGVIDARHTNDRQTSHAVAGSGARRRSRRRAGLGTVACAVVALAAAAPAASAAGWQNIVNVTAPGQHGESPQVAVSAAGFGKASAVWSADGQIRSALRPTMLLLPWLQSGNISGPSTGARYPQIAVDGQDNRIAIWSEYEEPYSVLYSAVRPAGGVWQAPVMLSLPGTYADYPHLVMNANGDAVAAWGLHDGDGNTVQAAVRPAGGTWQSPRTIGPRHSKVVGTDVAIGAQGDIAVVWENRGTPKRIEATMRPAGGSWQRPVDISSTSDLIPTYPDVAVDAKGNAVVAWEGWAMDTNERAVLSAERPSGGSWKAAVEIDASKLGWALRPQVAFDGTGRALAVWTRENVGLPSVVHSAERPAGGVWTKPVEISTHDVRSGYPRLAVNTKGDAVAVWLSRHDLWGSGTFDDAQGAVRPAGATWQAPVTLSPAGAKADEPQVGIDASGDAVAVWSHTTDGIVQSRSYAAG